MLALSLNAVALSLEYLDRLAAILAVLCATGVLFSLFLRRRASAPVEAAKLSRATYSPHYVAIGMVFLLAFLLRTVFLSHYIPYPVFGGLIQPLLGNEFVRSNNKLEYFALMFHSPGAFGWIYDSPLLTPIFGLLDALLGSSPHNAAIGGALAGILTLYCCWRIGSDNHSRLHGLILCMLLAVSSFQLTWSRLGYRAIWAVPHVLLVTQLSLTALRTNSSLYAFLSGIVAFCSIYNHDTARIALMLALCCVILSPSERTLLQRIKLLSSYIIALVISFLLLADGTFKETFWPKFTGPYAGYRGESGLVGFVEKNWSTVTTELHLAFNQLFLFRDAITSEVQFGWGPQYGGLISWPVALLGLLGLLVAVCKLRGPYVPWFFLLAGSLAVPALSCSQARRLLLTEVAWCAFATEGIVFLYRRFFIGAGSRLWLRTASAAIFVISGISSLASIWILSRLAPNHDENQRFLQDLKQVPYADGCNRDMVSCPRCVALGEEWFKDFKADTTVVLLDLIPFNGTIAGGMHEYGFSAAFRAGRPQHFMDFYGFLSNWSFLPKPGLLYPAGTNSIDAILARMRKLHSPRTKFYFVHPSAWERGFARALLRIGGSSDPVSLDSATENSFSVTIASEHYPELETLIRTLESSSDKAVPMCPSVFSEKFFVPAPDDVWNVGLSTTPYSPEHSWIGARYDSPLAAWQIILEGRSIATLQPICILSDNPESIRILIRTGQTLHLTGGRVEEERVPTFPLKQRIGRNCGVLVGSHSVHVDSWTGELFSTMNLAIPEKRWIAIGSDGKDKIALVTDDRILYLYSVSQQRILKHFPVTIMPVRDWESDECPRVLFGSEWIGVVLHTFGSRLDLYSMDGTLKRMVDLAKLLGITAPTFIPSATNGNRLILADNFKRRGLHIFEYNESEPCNAYFTPAGLAKYRRVLFDFERTLEDWSVEGGAFGPNMRFHQNTLIPGQGAISGFTGDYFINSFFGTDFSIGTLTSPPFIIDRSRMKLSVGGGDNVAQCAVQLVVNDIVVKEETGNNTEALSARWWDVTPWVGKEARIRIIDQATGAWGHILVDDIELVELQSTAP